MHNEGGAAASPAENAAGRSLAVISGDRHRCLSGTPKQTFASIYGQPGRKDRRRQFENKQGMQPFPMLMERWFPSQWTQRLPGCRGDYAWHKRIHRV